MANSYRNITNLVNQPMHIWNGPPQYQPISSGLIGSMGIGSTRKRFKQDRITKKLIGLAPAVRINEYFNRIETDSLIASFGNEKPLYRRRPKKWLQSLLLMGNFNRCFFNRSYLLSKGIIYSRPAIFGRRAIHYRITPATLMLLDHIAAKYPNFKKFVDAYISDQDRKEIINDCASFVLNILPKEYEIAMEKNDELYKKSLSNTMQSGYASGIQRYRGTTVSPLTVSSSSSSNLRNAYAQMLYQQQQLANAQAQTYQSYLNQKMTDDDDDTILNWK